MADKQKSKAAKLRQLQESFAAELPARFTVLWQAWNNGRPDPESGEFYRLVHSLAGSAGTFGFPQLGERARDLELQLKQGDWQKLDQTEIALIEQGLNELQAISDNGPEKISSSATDTPSLMYSGSDQKSHLIYVLEDDVTLAKEISQQLQLFGYEVDMFVNSSELKAGVAKQVPDALLADIHLPEGSASGPQAVMDLRNTIDQNIPVIFASGHNTWEDRLNAVRAGGQAYLSKPINFNALIEQLDTVTGKKEETFFRVLIVDDTELLAEHYSLVLQSAGMETRVLNNPTTILDHLSVFRPDLILMDLHMPECNGIEAAQVIRQHSAYTDLPIVYLSTERGLDQQLEALHVGGDDFLQKPISDNHLIAAVRIRARRFRELSSLMNRDGLTGLLNHINFKLALEREIAQSERRVSPFSIVMLDIDLFKSVNDTYGHPVGDQVIKSLARHLSQHLRKGDVAARYGGEEFAVILPDTPAKEAHDVIDNLRQKFEEIHYTHEKGEFSSTFSAGIAVYPANEDMESLIASADDALYTAKESGRNQVVINKNSLG